MLIIMYDFSWSIVRIKVEQYRFELVYEKKIYQLN